MGNNSQPPNYLDPVDQFHHQEQAVDSGETVHGGRPPEASARVDDSEVDLKYTLIGHL